MQLPIPGYDTLGRKVVIVRSGCFDPRNHRPEDLEKANFMVMECLAKKEERITIGGLVILFDMKGISMAHMMHKPLHMVKKQLKYIQVKHYLEQTTVVHEMGQNLAPCPTSSPTPSPTKIVLTTISISWEICTENLTEQNQEAIPLSPKALIFIRTSPVCSTILGLMVSVFSDKMKRRVNSNSLSINNIQVMVTFHRFKFWATIWTLYTKYFPKVCCRLTTVVKACL